LLAIVQQENRTNLTMSHFIIYCRELLAPILIFLSFAAPIIILVFIHPPPNHRSKLSQVFLSEC